MEYYGIKGVALKLFESYLSNRKQLTVIDNCESALDLIEWGVPQGSVLGPLLFLIFINDISHASNLGTWLFADDTSLVASASNQSQSQSIFIVGLQKKLNNASTKYNNKEKQNKKTKHILKGCCKTSAFSKQ